MRKTVVAMLLLALCSVSVLAARPEVAIGVEFLAGSLGAYAVASVGARVLSVVFPLGSTGGESLSRAILGAVVGFSAGSIAGSGLGVIATGSLFEVKGDVGMCFLGASAGTGAMLLLSVLFESTDSILPLFAPPIAAACAVAGYNLGRVLPVSGD
jgi:hypothetical protein